MAGASYPGAMRASDDDRSKVQALLNDAFAEGRLTQQEWEQRSGELVTGATFSDLDRLTSDLPTAYPGTQRGLVQASPNPGLVPANPSTNGMAVAALICGIAQLAVGLPAGIAAIILGHMAWPSPGSFSGISAPLGSCCLLCWSSPSRRAARAGYTCPEPTGTFRRNTAGERRPRGVSARSRP
jgi:hypothetical protein